MIKKIGIIFVLAYGVFFLNQNLESAWTFKRLTWNSGYSTNPAIISDSYNHIHVVWQDNSPGNDEIFYKKSTDSGANWTQKRLTWNSSYSSNPAIAAGSNNHIHVFWQAWTPENIEIFYKKSADGGAIWSSIKRLTWNSGNSSRPSIVVDSNNYIHMVWENSSPGNGEIFYKKSTDGGANWTQRRLTWNSGYSGHSTISTDSNNYIHVVWYDGTPGNFEIFYKRSTDSGANWTQKRLTWNLGFSLFPVIAVAPNNHIHVAWQDNSPGNDEIFYKKSTDSGANWTQKRLTWNSGYSCSSAIASDSNSHIHVVWEDSSPGNGEIFYKQSTDGGASWPQTRLTWNSGNSSRPSITVDSNNYIHVVWCDMTPGNGEIFYKKRD